MTRLEAGQKAVFIAASRYRRHSYGRNHPLDIPRVSLTQDLIQSYGAISENELVEGRKATPLELEQFHSREYVAAMQRSEALGKVLDRYRQRHNIGNFENPYFPGFFSTPATATAGSIQAAEHLLQGRVSFNPAGGMHHAMPDQAKGFCFFNDPALGILRLRQEGLRVLYVDIDAHHGDGVEYAFREDSEVLTFSIHMDTAYAYPFKGGGINDWGEQGNAVNLPLPKGVNDREYLDLFERLWPAVVEAFQPDAIVLQAGTDILLPDPLGKFQISTSCFLSIVEQVMALAPVHADGTPKLMVLGGGGYHPLVLARCWTGVWGILSGRTLPEGISPQGRRLLEAVEWDDDEDEAYYPSLFSSRVERFSEGELRQEIKDMGSRLLATHPLFTGERRR